ncbi:MAG: hydantoinase B/oxoprolinase family protein, partial [Rhizobium pusense]|nr:hydantoinase B/oxoprolinase family protein [Agrobacterium pusense]
RRRVYAGALGLALPSMMPAASSGVVIPVVVAEPNERGGRNVQVVEPMIGGTGARNGHDGVDGRDSGISNLANNPVETVEAELGIEILHYAIRPDSGGAGRWRGGCGLELTFRILTNGCNVLGRGMERLLFRPWGCNGGKAGAPGSLMINQGRDSERRLGKIDVLEVQAGDTVTFQTAGAGGWGDPFERTPEAVLSDVLNGFVTTDAARRDYGVVIVGQTVDRYETNALRARERMPDANFDFGPEREAWDEVFGGQHMDDLNSELLLRPLASRQKLRGDVFRQAMAHLPDNFPRQRASQDRIEAVRHVLEHVFLNNGELIGEP